MIFKLSTYADSLRLAWLKPN